MTSYLLNAQAWSSASLPGMIPTTVLNHRAACARPAKMG